MNTEIRIGKGPDGRIMVKFPYNPAHISKVKSIDGYHWHPEERCWSLPNEHGILDRLVSLFDREILDIDPSLQIRHEETWQLENLRKELVSRKYSPKTIKAYLHYNNDFLGFVKKDPSGVTNDDIKSYLVYLAEEKGSSASTLNIAINALNFYYGGILKKNFAYEIKRPKKDKKLPVVLSREEVSRILSSVANVKHKAILMLTYSAGLRVSEVVKLKPEDIDIERKLIHVKGAKGRKDRYTILSEVALKVLKEYVREYKPEKWLFCGAHDDRHISARTVQAVFENELDDISVKR